MEFTEVTMEAECREFHAKTDLMSNEFQGIHARTGKKETPVNPKAPSIHHAPLSYSPVFKNSW